MAIIFEKDDDNNIKMEQLVKQLTEIVVDEVNAYKLLLDALVEQQSAILKGDSEFVSNSNIEVDKIIKKTKELGKQRKGTSEDFLDYLEVAGEISLDNIIPHIETKYAKRLKEFKNILKILSEKVQTTNKRNKYLLENSFEFVDKCLKMLTEEQNMTKNYTIFLR